MSAQRAPLPGDRWHFAHGPIDLVIGAEGERPAVAAAHEAAWARFVTLLAELVGELNLLRAPIDSAGRDVHRASPGAGLPSADCPLAGPVARRMWQACVPFSAGFVTPMAAVAGAVADEIVAAYRRPGIVRAWVNNGGDIALHLAQGASVRVGLFADLARFSPLEGGIDGDCPGLVLDGRFEVASSMPVRGIATSGWRGRSFSLGIADSVTVLARTAAQADAAATIVANAVNVDDPRIVRRRACDLRDDTDLGELPVVVEVPALAAASIDRALRNGAQRARKLHDRGLLAAAVLVCQGRAASVGSLAGVTEPGQIAVECA